MPIRSLVLSLIFSTQALAAYDFTAKVNGSDELRTVANELTSLDMSFIHQETGMKPHHYMKMHEKPMHMIVVSDDLEHFAHVHPRFMHMSKDFKIDLNMESAPDPDNLDTVGTLPFSGRFFAFTEVMPHDEEMMMVYSRFAIDVDGPARRPSFPPDRKVIRAGEKMVKYYSEDGREAEFGSKYKATFDFEQYQWCSWFLPKFYVLIEVWDSETKSYKEPKELQRWLAMGGHAILISREAELEDVSFYHLHALLPIVTPGEFVFPYHDHQKGMNDGHYRMFMQFKHDDRVRKMFFDFEYENPPLPEFSLLRVPGFC